MSKRIELVWRNRQWVPQESDGRQGRDGPVAVMPNSSVMLGSALWRVPWASSLSSMMRTLDECVGGKIG